MIGANSGNVLTESVVASKVGRARDATRRFARIIVMVEVLALMASVNAFSATTELRV